LPGLDLELFDHFSGVVGRAAIRNKDYAPSVLEMFGQAMSDHLDHMLDSFLSIVARDTHEDIRCFDLLESLRRIGPKGGVENHHYPSFVQLHPRIPGCEKATETLGHNFP